MTAKPKTVLEWSYEPKGFFEEPCMLPFSGGEIIINGGSVRGEFDASFYDLGQDFRNSVHEHLTTAFLAQQVQVHTQYQLSSASMCREYPDGRRDVTVFADSLQIAISVARADIIIKDDKGNVLQDTKQERLKKQRHFGKIVSELIQSDIALKRMFQSFHNALEDKDNLFIHLYEVRDTLVSKFGNGGMVRRVLGISSSDWSKFGNLANNDPLLEGRHRGKHGALRSADSTEREWALSFTQQLIEEYVKYEAQRN